MQLMCCVFLFFTLFGIQGGFLISDKEFISALQYVGNREYTDIHNDSLRGCSREIKKYLQRKGSAE